MTGDNSLLKTIQYNVLFEGIDGALLDQVIGSMKEVHVPSGNVIFEYETEGECLYLILDGSVKVSRMMKSGAEAVLGILHPGDFFGELEVIDDRLRSAKAIAMQDSKLLALYKKEFNLLLKKSSSFTVNLLRMLSLRLRSSNQTFIQHCDANVEASRRQIDKLNKLVAAARIVNSSLDIDTLLELILMSASQVTGADRGTVYLLDEQKKELWSKTLQGSSKIEIRLPVGKGIAGYVAATGETINISEAYSDPRFNPEVDKTTGYKTKTILCMPMKNKEEKIIGVFQLLNKANGAFTEEDEEFIEGLSVHASIAIENAQLAQQMIQSERLSAVGRMASTIIHDIKNPMGTLRLYAQVMKNKAADEETLGLADEMIHQIDRFVNMTQEVLDFSRGISSMKIEEVKFADLMNTILRFVESDLEKRNVKLVKSIEYTGKIKLDPDKFMRAMFNVAGNAADAMPNGGQLSARAFESSGMVVVEMADTGIGMSSEVKARIFEPFITHGKKHGTGLGMAIVKKIIDDHKGIIEIDSVAGKGTTVRMKLPLR